jgi:hypothetical protein
MIDGVPAALTILWSLCHVVVLGVFHFMYCQSRNPFWLTADPAVVSSLLIEPTYLLSMRMV